MALKGGGGGASAGAIRAGAAFVELFTKDDSLKAGLKRAESLFRATAKAMSAAGAVSLGAGAAALTGIGKVFADVVNRDVEIKRFADKIGTSTEKLSVFAYAARTTGLRLEDLKGDFENLAERIDQGANGTGEAAEAFKRLGLDAAALKGKDFVDVMIELSAAYQKLPTDIDKLSVSSALGGDQFQWLRLLLDKGPAGIRALQTRARELGEEVTTEQAKQAEQVNEAWTESSTAITNAVRSVGVALLPQAAFIKEFSDTVVNVAKSAREWVAANQGVVLTAVGIAAAATAGGAALIGLGAAAAAAGVAISGAVALAGAVGTAFAVVTSPLFLTAAGLTAVAVGLGYAFAKSEQGRAVAERLAVPWRGAAEEIGAAFGAIGEALKRGDLASAGEVAMAGLRVEFARGTLAMTDIWMDFTKFFYEAFVGSVYLTKMELNSLATEIAKVLVGVAEQANRTNRAIADVLGLGRTVDLVGGFDDAWNGFADAKANQAGPEVAPMPREVREAAPALVRVARSAGQFGADTLRQALGSGDVSQKQLNAQIAANAKLDEVKAAVKDVVKAVKDSVPRFH